MKRNRKDHKIEENLSDFEEDDSICSSPEGELDSDESEPEFLEEESDQDLSEYESEEEQDEKVDSQLSEDEFDENTKLPVLTTKLTERLLKNASNHSNNSVKKLISVFSSVVASVTSKNINLIPDKKVKDSSKDSVSKTKFKYLKNENKRLLKGTAERFSDSSKLPKKSYVVKDWDVYHTFVSKSFDVLSEYLKNKDVLSKKEDVTSVAPLVRRFLSTSLVQLAFGFEDFDLTRSCLISLSSKHVVSWICVFKHLNNQFVKVVSSLMCAHPQKLTRVNCFQFLSTYLSCLRYPKLMSIQFSPRSYFVNYSKLSEGDRKQVTNDNINFLLKRVYSSHIKSVMNGITLKNYSLFKLTQNCIAELYLQSPYDNLYVHTFKCIRDLAFNVRREWSQPSKSGDGVGSKKSKKVKSGLTKDSNKGSSKESKNKNKSSDSTYLTVCSWGFIEAINIWVSVLSKSNEKMRALVYPLVTVINSSIKIKISNRKQIPFVLHLLTSLNQISDGVNCFIPMVSFVLYLIGQLKFKSLNTKKKPQTMMDKSEDIMIKLKLTNKSLNSFQTYKVLYKYIELILIDHLGLVSLNPGFPEFSIVVIHYIKRLMNTIPKEFKSSLGSLLNVIRDTSKVVTDLRNDLDVSKCESVLKVLDPNKSPLYKYRQDHLLKYQQFNKEKLLSTLSISNNFN